MLEPEQAAILIKNLHKENTSMAILVIRKISGKKAGKIIEALIPMDPVTATQLAKAALDQFNPETK